MRRIALGNRLQCMKWQEEFNLQIGHTTDCSLFLTCSLGAGLYGVGSLRVQLGTERTVSRGAKVLYQTTEEIVSLRVIFGNSAMFNGVKSHSVISTEVSVETGGG